MNFILYKGTDKSQFRSSTAIAILSQNRGLLFRPVLHQRRVHSVHGVHALHPPPPDAGPHHRREVHFQDPEDRSEGGKVLPEHRRGVALRERSGKSWG